MMCPGISYSTVHNLIFHTNGSVQDNKLFKEFCNKHQAHFLYALGQLQWIADHITWPNSPIDNETGTLMDFPDQEKYTASMDKFSAIAREYQIIRSFMRIHNIHATWVKGYTEIWDDPPMKFQLAVGPFWCEADMEFSCSPPHNHVVWHVFTKYPPELSKMTTLMRIFTPFVWGLIFISILTVVTFFKFGAYIGKKYGLGIANEEIALYPLR